MSGAPSGRPSHGPTSAAGYRPQPAGGGRPSLPNQPNNPPSTAPLHRPHQPNRQQSSPNFSSSTNPAAPPPLRHSTTSMVRIGPPMTAQAGVGRGSAVLSAERPIRSSSDEELKNRVAINSFTVQPSSRPSLGAAASSSPRPINTSLLSMYDSRSAQPHSAGVVGNRTTMNRSSSGTSLSTLGLQVTPSASPVSGSAAAAYALSAGLDASPASSSPLPGHSHTVSSSYPQSASSAAASPFDDVDGDIPTLVECYENQRYYPVVGWSSRLLPTDRPNWSTEDGTQAKQFTDFKCPPGWSWVSDWRIDKGSGSGSEGGGERDGEGWSYAVEFTREWKGEAARGTRNLVRRRRWVRKRQGNNKTVEQQRRSNQQLMPSAAGNMAANSLTVGSSARGGAMSGSGGLRAPLPINSNSLTFNKAPVSSAITRASVTTAPLSSLYSMGPAMVIEKKRRTVTALVKLVEYQRWYPIGGWKDQLLPTDGKPLWEDIKGRPAPPKDRISPNPKPHSSRHSSASDLNTSAGDVRTGGTGEVAEEEEPQWEWLGEWSADVTPSTDKDGWLYAIDFRNARWVGRKGIEHCVRKRVWVREKEKEEKKKDGRKVVEELLSKLERWERDVLEEERNEDLIKLGSAAW